MEPGRHPRRPTYVRRRFLALLAVLAGLTLLPIGGPASASCAGPSVDVPATLVRGETVQLTGTRFRDGCQDSMHCPAFGCGACEYDDPPPVPQKHVVLQLRQRGERWDLDTVDADRNGKVTWTVTVPDDVRPGRARLSWGDGPGTVAVRIS